MKEFKINGREETFRVGYISPVELLALSTQIDFQNYEQTKLLYKFSLEHIEVKVGEAWLPVKTTDKEVYAPQNIANDYIALNELCLYFMQNYIAKTFTQSSK